MPAPYPSCPDELNIVLGERYADATLSQEGVRFQWLTYTSDELSILMNRIGKGQTVNFVVSREDLGQVYVENPLSHQYIVFPSTRPE